MENQGYVETAILGADRMELIRVLYSGAIACVHEARRNLAAGEIMQRSKSISKALDFVSELALSLNHEVGGGLPGQLADLYRYVQQLLLKAHTEQSDAKLAEAARILETLLSGFAKTGLPSENLPEGPRVEQSPLQTSSGDDVRSSPYASGRAEPKKRSWDL